MEFEKIPRNQNMIADEIAKLASSEERSTSMGLDMKSRNILALKKPLHLQSKAQTAG